MNRKLRKLLRSPHLFFLDAGANLMRRTGGTPRVSASKGRKPCRWRYSLITVIACDADAKRATALMSTLASQTVDAKGFVELICVDTRAAGGAPWSPPGGVLSRVDVVALPRATQAQARNAALTRVAADWTSFVELDDTIAKDHLQRIDSFLKSKQAATVGLACCKLAYRDEATGQALDTHARKAQFTAKSQAFVLGKKPEFFVDGLAGVFFRTSLLRLHSARFTATGIEAVEDLAFATRFLDFLGGLQVGLVADVRMLVSARQQRHECEELLSSTVAGITGSAALLKDLLRPGETDDAHVPRAYLQKAVLHLLCTTSEHAVNNGVPAGGLAPAAEAALDRMYADVLDHIPAASIESFKTASFRNRVGLLKRYKQVDVQTQVLHIDAYDDENAWARLRYFAAEEQPLESFTWGSQDVIPAIVKSRLLEFLGRPFAYERTAWLPCDRQDGDLAAKLAKAPAAIYMGGKPREGLRPWTIAEELGRPSATRRRPWRARVIRHLAARPGVAAKFRDAWLFMDRDIEADDNAEHLYRYTRDEHPEVNSFFILHRKSPSWERLSREGFRLIPFGSLDHKLALLYCRHLLSSHAAPFVLNMLPKALYGDMLKYRFTFLQHGVTKDDISKWINTRSIDCFVTTSQAEYQSIASDGNRYKLTPREVVLTGFPRHDALLRGADKAEKLVMIMPTWRLFLAGSLKGRSSKRSLNEAFFESQYASAWKGMLHSERFARMLQQHGYKAVLFPHPNIEPYLDWFQVPAHIEVIRGDRRGSIQSLFQRAALMVTDYSSVAFEMAYLRKPVLYYQFDRDLVFGGQHSYQKGYYDYDRQGFGPVSAEETRLLGDLETFMARDCAPGPEYLARMDAAFAHIDTDNCKRTFEAVQRMDHSRNQRGAMPELLTAYAELASQNGEWELAADRWSRVTRAGDAAAQPHAALMQARAFRHLERIEEAAELLDTQQPTGALTFQYAVERAEQASASRRWDAAETLWRTLAASAQCSAPERERFIERAQECACLATESANEPIDADAALPHAVEALASDGKSMSERLSDWAAVLAMPQIDADVRNASRKELARLWIEAGDYEAAERDIATLRSAAGPSPSELLLSLELALARGHAGEATTTMNVMMGMPLTDLTRFERQRFARCLQSLTPA